MEGTLRSRDFRLLVASSGLSALGDELALIALTLKVNDLTHSGWSVAALLLAGLIPLVIFAPSAGVIVDNFETTRTLAVASELQALVAVGLAFATGLPAILVLTFLLGTVTAVATPALYTLVPAVVGEEDATAGNAYLETSRYVGMIAGPFLAGILTTRASSEVAMIVDAVTFIVIALAALALVTRRHPQASEVGSEDTKGEARAGLQVIRQDGLLVAVFVVIAAVILFAAMDNVAEVFFANDTLHAGSWGYGLLASAWLLGMAGGASLIAARLPKEGLVRALMAASVIGGLAVASAAAFGHIGIATALFVLGGLANGVQAVSMRSLIVHRTPDRARGRVFAAYGGVANGMQIGAMVLGGGVVVALGGRTVLMVAGLGSAAAGVIGYAWYLLLPADVRAMPAGDTAVAPAAQSPRGSVALQVPESEPFMRVPEPAGVPTAVLEPRAEPGAPGAGATG
jgi:MFS family permease